MHLLLLLQRPLENGKIIAIDYMRNEIYCVKVLVYQKLLPKEGVVKKILSINQREGKLKHYVVALSLL